MYEKQVREFHEVMGISRSQSLTSQKPVADDVRWAMCTTLAQTIAGHGEELMVSDIRWLRVQLIAEEFAELLKALQNRDEIETLDALADLLYVVIGTAVTFNLPLHEAFEEVHKSNMSKTKQSNEDIRLRCKGPDYQPPNLEAVLRRHRDGK